MNISNAYPSSVCPPCHNYTVDDDTHATSSVQTGWVNGPNLRGTIDILWSSLFTIFLCTWTALHLNLPSKHETRWQVLLRKARWMVQTIIGPEFVLALATGQRRQAKRSVLNFKALGYPQWTIRHGFYANMGGFVLQPRAGKAFPINGKQLVYLVKYGYLPFPDLTEKDLWDKSKADSFAKTITCMQTGWFVLQCIGRAIQQLPVTGLELTTVSFVLCTLAMYAQWLHKPLDIETPTICVMNASIEEVLVQAGDLAREPYRQTPLDFIDDLSPSWITDVQPWLRFRTGPRERPLQRFPNDRFSGDGFLVRESPLTAIRFPNDRFPDHGFLVRESSLPAIIRDVSLFLIVMAYASFHLIGWNLSFPTNTERILWRVSSLAIAATVFIFWMCENYQGGVRAGVYRKWERTLFPARAAVREAKETINGNEKNVTLVPLWEKIISVPLALAYSLARGYLIVAVFVGLRSLPVGAFDTVDWLKFIPHI